MMWIKVTFYGKAFAPKPTINSIQKLGTENQCTMDGMKDKKGKWAALIIDDDEFDLESLTAALNSNSDFSTVMCRTSGENLNSYLLDLRVQPDVILLDVNMPRINGFEVLKALKEDENLAHLPVIMFSSSTWGEDIETARNMGALAFLSKGSSYFGFAKAGKLIGNILLGNAKDFHAELKA